MVKKGIIKIIGVSMSNVKTRPQEFFWVKYVEEVGTGTNKIIKWCKEWKLPEPEFEETGTSFVLTFRRFYVSESLLGTLNERQKRAIEYLKTNNIINTKRYMEFNKVSDKTAYLELNNLFKKGILIREGKGRATTYRLKK